MQFLKKSKIVFVFISYIIKDSKNVSKMSFKNRLNDASLNLQDDGSATNRHRQPAAEPAIVWPSSRVIRSCAKQKHRASIIPIRDFERSAVALCF